MPSATHLDTWLIASVWLATNSFGFNGAELGVSSYWVVPLANVVTLFHHGYLFRDLRRNSSLPIRPAYKNLLLLIAILWLVGGGLSIWSSVCRYMFYDVFPGLNTSELLIIASFVSGILALAEGILVVVIWSKCSNYKPLPVRPSRSIDDLVCK
jgi:polyferredoxin